MLEKVGKDELLKKRRKNMALIFMDRLDFNGTRELEQYLITRGYTAQQAQETVADLLEDGLIKDPDKEKISK